MGFRDRFYTPTTAKAILSWRIVVGVAVGVVAGLIGLHPLLAACFGIAAYSSLVLLAVPRSATRAVIDPFTLSEPWRQLMQGAQGAGRKFRETVGSMPAGPLRDQLDDIDVQLQHALGEAWRVAKAGDEIDDVVRRLDPTTLAIEAGHRSSSAPPAQPSPEHEQRSRRCRDSSTPPNDSEASVGRDGGNAATHPNPTRRARRSRR